MAKNFYTCVKEGGKVFNKKTKEGKSLKVCYTKDGQSYVKSQSNNKNFKKQNQNPTSESLEQLKKYFNNY